jgi:hypothetical protein
MLSGGTMILSAWLLIQAEAGFDVGGRLESRVGQAPTGVTPNADGLAVPTQQSQVLLIATPELNLRYATDVDELRATSFTRALWRPEPLLHARPLFLEMLEFAETGRPSKRSLWRLNLRGTYGEEDYTSLAQQFTSQPTLPSAATVLMINGNGETVWRADRRTDLMVQVLGIHRRTVDSSSGTTAPGLVFPTQTTFSVAPGLRYLFSRRTTFEATAPVMDSDIGSTAASAPLNVLSVQPQLGIREQLTRNHQLHVAAGFAYAVALRHGDQNQSWPPILPLVQVDLTSYLRRSHDMQWRSAIGAATNAFADPVLGVEVLRASAQARLDVDFGPNWGLGALVVFATDINGPLQPIGGNTPAGAAGLAPDETLVTAEIPFHYRWPNRFQIELGGRFAERAPHLRSPNFGWRANGRELWLFLSMSTLAPTVRRPSASVSNAARVNATVAEPPSRRPPPPPVPSPL